MVSYHRMEKIMEWKKVKELILAERKACAKLANDLAWKAFKDKERAGIPTPSYLQLDGKASAGFEIGKLIEERPEPEVE